MFNIFTFDKANKYEIDIKRLYTEELKKNIISLKDLTPNISLDKFRLKCNVVDEKMKPLIDIMVDYFETKNYVFVHACLPVTKTGSLKPTWRKANSKEWSESRWGNPFTSAEKGILPANKILVFGHWHTSSQWAKKENLPERGIGAKYDIYFGDKYIGLDSCTALSNKVNVLVLEDEFLDKE